MISVKFLSKCGQLCGFEVCGHATENEDDLEGKLVCAFVSSACLMACNTATEIIGDGEAAEDGGYLKFYCETPSESTVKLLDGLKLHLTELKKQYGKRIKIYTEV